MMQVKTKVAAIAAGVLFVASTAGWCASTPQATTAKVEATINDKPVALNRNEQIALMFMSAIADIEDDCMRHAGHACSLDEMVRGPKSTSSWPISRLKFDPRTTDPDYTYVVTASTNKWEAKAIPKKPGLGGFYFLEGVGMPHQYYDPKGAATETSSELDGYTVSGDSFSKN